MPKNTATEANRLASARRLAKRWSSPATEGAGAASLIEPVTDDAPTPAEFCETEAAEGAVGGCGALSLVAFSEGGVVAAVSTAALVAGGDRKSTRLNSSH